MSSYLGQTLGLKALLITAVAMALGILSDTLVFKGGASGIGLALFSLLILGGFAFLNKAFGKNLPRPARLLIAPLVFFSFMVLLRASDLLASLNILAAIALLLLTAETSFRRDIRQFAFKDYFGVLLLPFRFIAPFFETLGNLFSTTSSPDTRHRLWPAFAKGAVIALPFLIVFSLLFASADPVFDKYFSDVFDFSFRLDGLVIFRLIRGAFYTALFMGAFAYVYGKQRESEAGETQHRELLGHIEAAVVLGSVSLLFLFFIILQFAYLFGGATNIAVEGFTYAEYARKGFFELLAVSGIAFILLLYAERYTARKTAPRELLFNGLATVLVVQVFVIILSAIKRLALYEQTFGFTTSRLFSHLFIIWLAVVFLLLLYKILFDRQDKALVRRIFVSAIVFLVALNLLNPDVFIAKKNIDRFQETGKMDEYYLSRNLSLDVTPQLVELYQTTGNLKVKNALGTELYFTAASLDETPWQSRSLATFRAEKALEPLRPELEKYKPEEIPPETYVE